MTDALDKANIIRKNTGEPPIEYFAPFYVEAKDDGEKIINTEKPLFYNYIFIHASENELFRMKKSMPQYNFPRKVYTSDGAYHYPYISDTMIRDLQWIARSYAGIVPVYVGDSSWLVKGDRIKIVRGPLKGVEAQVFDNPHNSNREIMVLIGEWMSVPLFHVKDGDYRVVSLAAVSGASRMEISDTLFPPLHEALLRHHSTDATSADSELAAAIVAKYSTAEASTAVMRCKQYSLLLMAYTILRDAAKQQSLLDIIRLLLPTITAEQSLALMFVTLYGCTDNSIYHDRAHQLLAPWAKEPSPKKNKQQLLQRLSDYDRVLGH